MPQSLTDAARLIRDTWEETAAERGLSAKKIAIFNAGDGFLGTEMRVLVPGAQITLFERDARLAEAAGLRDGLLVPETSEPEVGASADLVILLKPKGRALARRQIAQAWQMLGDAASSGGCLASGGRLWICGPSQRGVKGLVTDASGVFGAEPEVLACKHKQRLVEVIRKDEPIDTTSKKIKKWWGTEGIMPGTVNTFDVSLLSGGGTEQLAIQTTAGVFSWEHLDEGTRILVEAMGKEAKEVWQGKAVADVGCGAGVLGIAAAKLGAGRVVMSDIDRLAVCCSRVNAQANGVGEVCQVVASDNLPLGLGEEVLLGAFDEVVSNPAFHQGEEVDYTMAQELAVRAGHALKPGGRLWVVANRFLAYHRYLNPVFGDENVTKAYEDNKFVIFLATRPDELPPIDSPSG